MPEIEAKNMMTTLVCHPNMCQHLLQRIKLSFKKI